MVSLQITEELGQSADRKGPPEWDDWEIANAEPIALGALADGSERVGDKGSMRLRDSARWGLELPAEFGSHSVDIGSVIEPSVHGIQSEDGPVV